MKRPIGFIDSGVGGLTVLKEALKQLPNESMIFLGDSARCPYGTRPVEEIRQYTLEMVQFLLEKNIKMLVIACNTATAVVLEELQNTLTIPVVGVIQAGSLQPSSKRRMTASVFLEQTRRIVVKCIQRPCMTRIKILKCSILLVRNLY